MKDSLLKAARIIRRDFSEIEKIQNSKKNLEKFVYKSIENIKETINVDLIKARPDSKIIFIDEDSILEKNLEYCFVVEPISGIKNYTSGISYFASSIVLKMAQVNRCI